MLARVGRLVLVLVGALLVGVALVALVAPRPPFTVYRQPVVIGATLAFLLVGMLWRPPARPVHWLARARRVSWSWRSGSAPT